MKETYKILLHKTVKDFKYKHLLTEDVPCLCFWQGNVIATGQDVKYTEGKTTKASLPF